MNPNEPLSDEQPLPPPAPNAASGQPPAAPAERGSARHALPEGLNAAREARAFVAQLFAEVHAEQAAGAAEHAPAQGPAEPAAAAADAVPAAGEVGLNGVPDLREQTVLVLGLGASGLAMARWCARAGARVNVVDTRSAPPRLSALQAELPAVRFRSAALEPALLDDTACTAVFKSPGLAPAAVAPLWQAAQARGLWLGGELDLFSHALRRLRVERGYAPQILAVTGTNGKTTTTALTGQLLAQAGRRVAVAGNIGPTLLDTLAQRLDGQDLPEVWVLELSSFQLDGVQDFEPTAAVVLNLTQDHLDWHGDMQAYAAAKARVFGSKALMVLNRDDPAVMAMLPAPAKAKGARGAAQRAHVTFGADVPQRAGDYGIEQVGGMAWLVRALPADETQKRRRTDDEELFIQRLMPADALRIRGRHNATNALAALALAQAAGCPLAPLLYGLREYRGEPHRVEPVAIVREVEYFDDSKGTNVGATVAALNGLGAERPVVVILGGDGKGQDFSPLYAPLQRHARAAVLIGRDAPAIRAAVQGSGVPLLDAATLPEAVRLAQAQARPGDAVLLSPACASFDMFDNYEHRARVFVEAVRALATEEGEIL
jgi:UDP-N-acetylmuramoylalanine--D-glutamate ligase